MANSVSPFQPAIDELEKELADVELQRNGLISTINVLRAKAGQSARTDTVAASSPDSLGGSPAGGGRGTPSIRHDSFFGKKMGTAAREYLEMRFDAAGGTSPAKPREIFDALKTGGFVFETKDDSVAIISLRNMLRKASSMFQKLPNGTYGLRSWYPGARKPKSLAQDDDDSDSPRGVSGDELRAKGIIPPHARIVGEK